MIDSPSFITYHHLSPWLHGNLVLVDLTFNFDDPKNHFESKLNDMLDRFDGGDLKEYTNFNLIFLRLKFLFRWSRFLVVITTHSDPRTGDLHIAPNNTGSVLVNEVSYLFLFLYLWISEFHSRSLPLCFQNAFAIYYRETRRTSSIYCLVVHYQARRGPGKKSRNLLLCAFLTCII